MKQFKQLRKRRADSGFSLAELMVVIVIIGLLATLVVPNVFKKLFQANIGIAKSDITAIDSAVTSYMLDYNGKSPDSLEDLITEDEYGDKYLDRDTIPTDPWGNEYQYEPSDNGGTGFLIFSYGADGVEGGEGKDQDITNHMIKNKEI